MRNLSFILALLCLVSCQHEPSEYELTVEETSGLRIYHFSDSCSWDLACGNMPKSDNSDIFFCAEAAFTGQCLDTFSHSNIMGPHVSRGIYYEGYACNSNYATFCWTPDTAFITTSLENVATYTAFTQFWVIRNDSIYKPQAMKSERRNFYRALAEVNGKYCIIESIQSIGYGDFLDLLIDYGVNNALYMDMGSGWNYSFWFDEHGKIHIIHPETPTTKYCTNWLVICK